MQWPERGKAGRIGPAQRKSVEGMYVGCRGQGRGSSWAQELWYSQVRVQLVLQHINGLDLRLQKNRCRWGLGDTLGRVHPSGSFSFSFKDREQGSRVILANELT